MPHFMLLPITYLFTILDFGSCPALASTELHANSLYLILAIGFLLVTFKLYSDPQLP